MAVTNENNKVVYICDGSTTSFAFTFPIYEDSDLVVTKWTIADGTEDVLTLDVDYTVAGAGSPTGGSVDLLIAAPSSDYKLIIERILPLTQETDYVEGDPFPAQSHEDALDKLTMICQQLNDICARTVHLATGTTLSSLVFPEPVSNQLIGWNNDGTALVNIPYNTSGPQGQKGDKGEKGDPGTGTGNVNGPDTNTDEYVPQWDGADSKTLKNGVPIGTGANALLRLDGAGKLPAIDGSALTNLPAANKIASVFDEFGGNGEDGAKTVSSDANFSTIDGSTDGILQCTSLTINVGQTLTIDTGIAIIGVQGALTIHGTINADGYGASGGAIGYSGVNAISDKQYSKSSAIGPEEIMGLGGAGGGGINGGYGGGAGGRGGDPNVAGTATPTYKKTYLGGLLKSNSLLQIIISSRGGGGGCGSTYAAGGNGGGVIYIECETLVFDGSLTADGLKASDYGGGGGGGTIIIKAKSILKNTGTITVDGGAASGSGGKAGASGYSSIIDI